MRINSPKRGRYQRRFKRVWRTLWNSTVVCIAEISVFGSRDGRMAAFMHVVKWSLSPFPIHRTNCG
jgi:hypothetical protein